MAEVKNEGNGGLGSYDAIREAQKQDAIANARELYESRKVTSDAMKEKGKADSEYALLKKTANSYSNMA